jgi:GH15 family glucan-1,4-alpha-glucosidase
MCWTACDRLAKIARHLDLTERADHWQARAQQIHDVITDRAWDADKGMFSDAFGGGDPDASLLLMPELGFLPPNDPRIESTVEKLEEKLLKGSFMYRYAAPDDFGEPENAFNICTFWYIEALALMGRTDEARAIFGAMLECRNRSGLLSEDIDPKSRELWGNYPQTYSLVGIINSAIRLSRSWEDAV